VSNLGGVAQLPLIVDDPCTVKFVLPFGTVKISGEVHVQLPAGIVKVTVLALTEFHAAETSASEQDFALTCARQGSVGTYQNDKSSASENILFTVFLRSGGDSSYRVLLELSNARRLPEQLHEGLVGKQCHAFA